MTLNSYRQEASSISNKYNSKDAGEAQVLPPGELPRLLQPPPRPPPYLPLLRPRFPRCHPGLGEAPPRQGPDHLRAEGHGQPHGALDPLRPHWEGPGVLDQDQIPLEAIESHQNLELVPHQRDLEQQHQYPLKEIGSPPGRTEDSPAATLRKKEQG